MHAFGRHTYRTGNELCSSKIGAAFFVRSFGCAFFKSFACTFCHCFTDYSRQDKKGIIVLYFDLIFVRFGVLSRQNAKRKRGGKTMKKKLKGALSLLLCMIMVFGAVVVGGEDIGKLFSGSKAEATEYSVGDIIEFGSYPQSEVTKESDSSTYAKLEAASKNWVSYRYYSGSNSFGSMKPGDWMEYADIDINGDEIYDYRAVRFSQYRPSITKNACSADNSNQDNNKYYVNNIYYFKYEPLKWRVTDPKCGLVLSVSIIDAQAYNNKAYSINKRITNDVNGRFYANDYETSSIRKWLNSNFYNTAFTHEQKKNILTTELDNSISHYSDADDVRYVGRATNDKVFLLALGEGGNYNGFETRSSRRAKPTSYAKAQGIEKAPLSKSGKWLLRSPFWFDPFLIGGQAIKAVKYNGDDMFACSDEISGIRPAIRLANLSMSVFESDMKKVGKEGYAVFVVDANGNRLSEAKVTWNSNEAVTGNDGMVVFNKSTVSEPRITVSKNGYITYDNQNTNYSKSSSGFDVVTLYQEGTDEAYKLTNARYINGITSQDILIRTKRLSLGNGNEKFGISCAASTSTGVACYELMQGTESIAVSNNGVFNSLRISDFSAGDDIKVAVRLNTGKSVVTTINLAFDDDKFAEETSISLGKDIKIKVDDDIPFIGGNEISIDFPILPVETYIDFDGDGGGKVHVGINADILNKKKKPSGGWTDDDKKTIETQIAEVKEVIKTIKDYKDGAKKSLGKKDLDKLNSVMKEQKKSNLPGLDGIKLNFIGYGEGSWNNAGFSTISINLFLVADLKGISFTQQLVVVVVPVVINIGAGLKVTSSVIGSYDFQKRTFNADWAVNFSPSLEVFGGVGIGKAIGVGAYGNATMDIGVQILGTSSSTGLDTVDLTGEMGVKAYFAIFEYKHPFPYKTYHLYTRTKKMPAKASQVKRMNMYDAANYEVQDISYLSGESAWLSGASGGPAKAPAKAPTTTVIKPLLTQTYRNSQPQIVSTASSTVMIYTGADTSRDVYNITRAMYSVYDRSSGTWSAPLQADSNTTADSAPYLWTDGTDIYMIYLDSAKQFGSSDTVESYAAAQNIAITKFNSQSGRFDPVTTIAASDGGFYSLPKLCINNGALTAVWQRSTGDVFGCNSSNSVIYSVFNGQSWSAPEKLADGLNSIVDISADAGNVYYICDGDNDLNTTGDRSLTKQDFGGESTLLDSGTVSSIRLDGVNVYWYSGGTYKKYDGSTAASITNEPIIGATDRFCVTDGQIMFLAATQNASDIYTVAYDPSSGEYGEPVKYTDQDQYIDTFSAASVDGQTLAVMTRRDVTITEDNVDDKCELAYTLIRDRHDIAVNSVDYDEESVIPGGNLPLRIEVGNAGTSTVSSVDVTITDAAGNVIVSETHEVSITHGATEPLTVEMVVDDEISLKEYNVTVTETNSTDANNLDNSCEFKIGYCKLDVTATPIIAGERHYVIVEVKNVSNVSSDGTLNVSNSTEPDRIDKINFDVLEPGESYICKIGISETLLDGNENVIKIMAESTAEQHDLYSHTEHVYCNLDEFKVPTGYTITWDFNGESLTDDYYYGDTIHRPEPPERNCYIFTGWSPSVPDVMPAQDLTFTALFEPIKIRVIVQTPPKRVLNYGETLVLKAYISSLPTGARIVWKAVGRGAEIYPAKDGRSCEIKATGNGKVMILATVVDDQGVPLTYTDGSRAEGMQEIMTKDGLFLRIAAFFKKLFGSNMVIPSSLNKLVK